MASRGLPTNPRPRTKSTPTSPTIRPPVQRPALPSSPRARPSQLSQRERIPDPTPPRVSRWESVALVSPPRRYMDHSPTSSTSSGSSARTWGTSSSASSRTTVQSEDEFKRQYSNSDYDSRTSDLQNIHSQTSYGVRDAAGFGWGKVTEAASVLTQEVSKVWATGLNPLLASDNSAAEGESELTRVMRAYHLSKARHPSELPNWLFSDRERGQLGGFLRPEVHSDDSQAPLQRNHPDIATRNPESRLKNIQNFPTAVNRIPPMKTSGVDSRLKMLREKRSAPGNRM